MNFEKIQVGMISWSAAYSMPPGTQENLKLSVEFNKQNSRSVVAGAQWDWKPGSEQEVNLQISLSF